MIKRNLIPAILMLTAVIGMPVSVNAQEKPSKEKELQMQQAIDEQKKAIQKSQEELNKLIEQSVDKAGAVHIDEGNMPDPVNVNRSVRAIENSRNLSRIYSPDQPFIFNQGGDFFGHFGEDVERTTWDFSKNMKEGSFSRDYTFDVDEQVKTVVMSVNGDCKSGDIRIKITLPNGKTYSDIVIDEFGNLNWRKSFNISETENKDKIGAWKFDVSASKATGYFKISLQTF